MEYSDEERALARKVVANKNLLGLLAKVLVSPNEVISSDLVAQKTNEQLGELVRADDMARQKIVSRWGELIRLGTPVDEHEAAEIAPE